MQASFSKPALMYHAIGKFIFPDKDLENIRVLAKKAFQQENLIRSEIPLRLITRSASNF